MPQFAAFIPYLAATGATLLGSSMSANASKNASNDQMAATMAGLGLQGDIYNQGYESLSPYRAAGSGALTSLQSLLGITPGSSGPPALDMNSILGGLGGPNTSAGGGMFATMADPLNLFKGNTTKALDPIGTSIFGQNSALNLGHDVSSILGGLASGGTAQGGRTYVVGERGPEVLHMAPGSKGFVEPNSPKANMMAYGHREYGGPVGAMIGDPILGFGDFGRFGGGGYQPGTPLPQPIHPYSPIPPGTGPFGGMMRHPMLDGMMMGGRGFETRAGGGPVEGFNPMAGNNTQLTSGQTPNSILAGQPQYEFVQQQGLQALDNSAAASGGLMSGGHIKDILNYSQGLAGNTFQQIVNNLSNVASLGASASSFGGQTGVYSGMSMGNLLSQYGNASASGAIGQANAYGSGMSQLALLASMYGNGGYGGGGG